MRQLAIALLLLPIVAGAQTYKCLLDGKTVFADSPCAPDARPVGGAQDQVDPQARQDAEALRRKEAAQREVIESREAGEEARQRQAAKQYLAEEAVVDQEARRRCAQARQDQARAQRDKAYYQDLGWQQSLIRAKAEEDAAASRVFRDCR